MAKVVRIVSQTVTMTVKLDEELYLGVWPSDQKTGGYDVVVNGQSICCCPTLDQAVYLKSLLDQELIIAESQENEKVKLTIEGMLRVIRGEDPDSLVEFLKELLKKESDAGLQMFVDSVGKVRTERLAKTLFGEDGGIPMILAKKL